MLKRIPEINQKFGSPKGNRTPALALRGLRPKPLDDGAMSG